MSNPKKNTINNSSLIDLKAELLRKQQQYKKEKSVGGRHEKVKPKEKKTDIWTKSNAGVRERSQKDLEAKQEEEDSMSKSRKMLEKKAKLYETMASGETISEEDGSKMFLVDFEQKSIGKIVEERSARQKAELDRAAGRDTEADRRRDEEDVRKLFLKDNVPEPENTEEEWVDYTDSLGRSRRCMKKDLPELQEMDKNLSNQKSSSDSNPDLMSADMYREKLRQRWEKEEIEAMDEPAGPVHYANVQHEEIRTHGVGFYQFDKKVDKRDDQLDELTKLREQTKDKRAAHKRMKDKRKAMLAARLAKVKQRKAVREGKDPMEALDPALNSDDSDDNIIGPKLEEREPEPLKRDMSWKKDAPIREWDKDKEDLEEFLGDKNYKTENQWMDNQRQQRNPDFAPPSIYKDDIISQPKHNQGRQTVGKKTWTNPMATFDDIKKHGWKDDEKLPEFAPPASYQKSGSSQGNSKSGSSFYHNKPSNTWTGGARKQPTQDLGDVIGSTLSAIRAQVDVGKTGNTKPKAQTSASTGPNVSDIPLPPTSGTVPSSKEQSIPVGIPKNDMNQDEQYQAGTTYVGGSSDISSQPYGTNYGYSSTTATSHGFAQTNQGTNITPEIQHVPYQYGTATISAHSNITQVPNQMTQVPYTQEYPGVHYSSTVTQSQQLPADPVQKEAPSTTEPAKDKQETSTGPQPAHYSSAPMKPQPKKPRYERINLHELPMTLPAPPTAGNVPEYPSQEEVFGPQPKTEKKPMTEEQAVKKWQKQFDGKGSHGLKPANIPFASPFIKNTNQDSSSKDPALEYDPEKPPPNLTK